MSAAARLAAFALALAAVFGAAAAVGRAVGPFDRSVDVAAHEEMQDEEPGGGAHAAAAAGLSVADGGFRLVARSTSIETGRPQEFSFTILRDGQPLRQYDVAHEREMHLIVVRRDLGVFLHVHPERRAGGSWSAILDLPTGGVYRAFADFSTGGAKQTLGVDVVAAGSHPARAERAPQRSALVEGYRVVLRHTPRRAGEETALRFVVTRDGRRVAVDEYLGARGHLVLLREGDLAYVHTHAEEGALLFETTFPTPGRYRAFLQFEVGGAVRTAAFDVRVGP